jgi:negative regulator of flagellin synthesis FlgM
MTDGIYNNVRRPASDAGARGSASKTDSKSASASALGAIARDNASLDPAAVAAKPKTAGADQLHLSNVTKRVADQPGFDRAKVESIKKAIEDGMYPLDPRRIAESFHAIEQMIQE